MLNNSLDDYINSNPKQTLQIAMMSIVLSLQTIVGVLAIILYLLLTRQWRFPWYVTLSCGFLLAIFTILIPQHSSMLHVNLIHEMFICNVTFWKILVRQGIIDAGLFLMQNQSHIILGFPLFITGILSLIDLMPTNPHLEIMHALQTGKHLSEREELTEKEIATRLRRLNYIPNNGTLLGVSKFTGAPCVIPDHDVNQVVLVLGTTGAGKTITLKRFYQHAIEQGDPLIIIDGKPDDFNIEWIKRLAHKHKRPFLGFNRGNSLSYNPLAVGGYTELKDKIICLKDEWSSDYYRSIAEDYLQTTIEVLQKVGKPLDLQTIVDCLNYEELALLVREIKDEALAKRVYSLEHYDRKDITGLQAHLNILIHSELGVCFEHHEIDTINLSQAIEQNAVVYFALPALRFPSFSKVLGKLVINDIKAIIDRNNVNKKVFTIFDEFSVFAGEQVLNLVNMGRGKGLHAVFGTQGLADLDKVDKNFKNQILNCANTLICHRLNDQESAETVANWIGTQDAFTLTAQLDSTKSGAGLGSVRRNKEFIVHPDSIKQGLKTGEAFYVSKVGGFRWEKVRVKYCNRSYLI